MTNLLSQLASIGVEKKAKLSHLLAIHVMDWIDFQGEYKDYDFKNAHDADGLYYCYTREALKLWNADGIEWRPFDDLNQSHQVLVALEKQLGKAVDEPPKADRALELMGGVVHLPFIDAPEGIMKLLFEIALELNLITEKQIQEALT